MDKNDNALILVDLQKDFLPGGALGVKEGDLIVDRVNNLIKKCKYLFKAIVATRDWHPKDHCSFKETGGPWPAHCIQGSSGAEFASKLILPDDVIVISKGTSREKDAYSGFEGTDLLKKLTELKIKRLYVAGIATDYCVKHTVLDGLQNDFEVFVIEDCIKGVTPATATEAINDMKRHGAIFITSKDIC